MTPTPQVPYVEMQVDNAEPNVGKYQYYTTDWNQAQVDCNKESTCVGCWERTSAVNGGTISLLFPDSNGRSWKSGTLPNTTVKLAKKKLK